MPELRPQEEAVFRALADPTRRELLDELRREDGQTLTALEERLPMTRFGVMKHLRVLEAASLVVTTRRGREKRHFLNAVPIQEVYERWVSGFAAGPASGLTALRRDLEAGGTRDQAQPQEETQMETQEQTGLEPYRVVDGRGVLTVFEIYIKTSPERLWHAITDEESRSKYTFGVGVRSEWTPGSGYTAGAGGQVIMHGENLEVDPPRRLVQSFEADWSEEVSAAGPSRVTWEIEPVGDSCRLRVTHDQLAAGASSELWGGWPMILSGLKTLLETGELLTTPGSLRYASGVQA